MRNRTFFKPVSTVSVFLFLFVSLISVPLSYHYQKSDAKSEFFSSGATYANHWRSSQSEENNFAKTIKRNRIKHLFDLLGMEWPYVALFSGDAVIISIYTSTFQIEFNTLNFSLLPIPPPIS